jgi:hypothetical protein
MVNHGSSPRVSALESAVRVVRYRTRFSQAPRALLALGGNSADVHQVHLDQALQPGGSRFAGKQANLDARTPICLKLTRAFEDLQVAAENGPRALADSSQPVLVLCSHSGLARPIQFRRSVHNVFQTPEQTADGGPPQ